MFPTVEWLKQCLKNVVPSLKWDKVEQILVSFHWVPLGFGSGNSQGIHGDSMQKIKQGQAVGSYSRGIPGSTND